MNKTIYRIAKMDCPCEENLIRMKLANDLTIKDLTFDLSKRTLTVYHTESNERITSLLESLDLSASVDTFAPNIDYQVSMNEEDNKERRALWIVLIINFAFFLIEMLSGFYSCSMGLVADSLDMLADALVYGMSIIAVGRIGKQKKRVALFSGLIQIVLAVSGLLEVIRRVFDVDMIPDSSTMIAVSGLALVANSFCLWILHRMKSKEAHIQASLIFSANDIIINAGVIIAAFFVWLFDSKIPDLLIGLTVFFIVIKGALRILRLAK